MITSKCISTISFNTEGFLIRALDKLLYDRRISEWHYIKHLPEDDECGNKEHFHVFVCPACRINTLDLDPYFSEFDPMMPEKPRKCIQWRISHTFADWYLYGLHDKVYLATKGESRRYHYQYDDVKTSDPDDLYFSVSTISKLDITPYQDMLDAIENGITWEQYFARGRVPINSLSAFKYAYELLSTDVTNRGGRVGHE